MFQQTKFYVRFLGCVLLCWLCYVFQSNCCLWYSFMRIFTIFPVSFMCTLPQEEGILYIREVSRGDLLSFRLPRYCPVFLLVVCRWFQYDVYLTLKHHTGYFWSKLLWNMWYIYYIYCREEGSDLGREKSYRVVLCIPPFSSFSACQISERTMSKVKKWIL